MPFADLVGKTLTIIFVDDDQSKVTFIASSGEVYEMHHNQDCCEYVSLEDTVGDLTDLLGSPILQAEESSSDTLLEGIPSPSYRDIAETWTFYKLATIRGSVTLRWYGSSNGYYSTDVSFYKVK